MADDVDAGDDDDDGDDGGDDVSAEARAAGDRAAVCIDERRFVDAIPDAERATELAPDWPLPWRYLAVAYKHDLRFRECLAACQHAVTGDDDWDQGVHWNAGIAATALEDWEAARVAWKACGIDIPAGTGPVAMNIGLAPIRLEPKGKPEVVWCERLDPCRARIISIPLPDSRRRHGDILLHDGEPRGKRTMGGRELAVFDELTLLTASQMGTWVIEVDVASADALAQLLAPLEGTEHEDWTDNVRALCAACSLGTPHDHDDDDRGAGWQRRRRIGVAAPSEASFAPLRGFLGRWRKGVVSVTREL
jgi:hypothetical protein